MPDKAPYTVEARLLELLELSPVDRGGIWWIKEELWEQVHPDYAAVRNPGRDGHYGLGAQTLDPATLGTVDILHGHSKCRPHERWYHLKVKGLSKTAPKRKTMFDVLHRFPFLWRLFFTGNVQNYLYRPRLTASEIEQLERIEADIRRKFEQDAQTALTEYQQNPAWKNCFPGQY
jgi:hypothetical protein